MIEKDFTKYADNTLYYCVSNCADCADNPKYRQQDAQSLNKIFTNEMKNWENKTRLVDGSIHILRFKERTNEGVGFRAAQ